MSCVSVVIVSVGGTINVMVVLVVGLIPVDVNIMTFLILRGMGMVIMGIVVEDGVDW